MPAGSHQPHRLRGRARPATGCSCGPTSTGPLSHPFARFGARRARCMGNHPTGLGGRQALPLRRVGQIFGGQEERRGSPLLRWRSLSEGACPRNPAHASARTNIASCWAPSPRPPRELTISGRRLQGVRLEWLPPHRPGSSGPVKPGIRSGGRRAGPGPSRAPIFLIHPPASIAAKLAGKRKRRPGNRFPKPMPPVRRPAPLVEEPGSSLFPRGGNRGPGTRPYFPYQAPPAEFREPALRKPLPPPRQRRPASLPRAANPPRLLGRRFRSRESWLENQAPEAPCRHQPPSLGPAAKPVGWPIAGAGLPKRMPGAHPRPASAQRWAAPPTSEGDSRLWGFVSRSSPCLSRGRMPLPSARPRFPEVSLRGKHGRTAPSVPPPGLLVALRARPE